MSCKFTRSYVLLLYTYDVLQRSLVAAGLAPRPFHVLSGTWTAEAVSRGKSCSHSWGGLMAPIVRYPGIMRCRSSALSTLLSTAPIFSSNSLAFPSGVRISTTLIPSSASTSSFIDSFSSRSSH